jgi:hypothetical protein
MPVIRTCKSCGQKNRIAAAHLADTGRCGACKTPLPPLEEPLPVDIALFDEIIQNSRRRSRGRTHRKGHGGPGSRPQGRHRQEPATRRTFRRAWHPELRRLLCGKARQAAGGTC